MNNYNHKYLNEERTQDLIDDIKEKMSSGGHTIQNASGMEMTSRQGLQFEGRVDVTDDETNNKTIVDVVDIYDDEVIALHETSNASEHAYSKGDLFILNNKLYEATVDINIGDELSSESRFVDKTWNGLSSFNGNNIWTDGEHIYYSYGSNRYILDEPTGTWSVKTWNGLSSFSGDNIWSDGENIYYSSVSSQYVLNKATSTWSVKTWNGLSKIDGFNIWTDGEDIYYSAYGSRTGQYVLDKSTSTWNAKTWNGLNAFNGANVWKDKENIYLSFSGNQYILDKSTDTWVAKTWYGFNEIIGQYVWTDGNDIYYSRASTQYVLNRSTDTWITKTWSELSSFYGESIWTDGDKIYYSQSSNQYLLKTKNCIESDPITKQLDTLSGNITAVDNRVDGLSESILLVNNRVDVVSGSVLSISGLVDDLQSDIATVEESTTSAHSYAKDEFLILNGKFYKTTQTVNVGDTLAVGTNITQTKVSDNFGSGGGGVMEADTVTIATSDWEASVTYSDYPYRYAISIIGMTPDYFVDAELVSGTFEDSWAVASESGVLTFYVESLPTESLTFKYWYMKGE